MDKQYTILCVDDEEAILKSLERILRIDGYKIISVLSGEEGLEVLKTNEVDLIIADQRMPQMSGSEFLSIVKEEYPDIPRIMISGYSNVDDLVKAFEQAEISLFLAKPWSNNELRDIIRNTLTGKTSEK